MPPALLLRVIPRARRRRRFGINWPVIWGWVILPLASWAAIALVLYGCWPR
jgi:hypothetical protein